jgi:CheY-like chemotaxis protein/anti-sigma regulatory factor (Ser/Thr protein kinase)
MADDPKRDALGALHEVSNALTVMLGWVGEARDPGATTDEVSRALRIVEQRGRAARDLARRAIGAKVPKSMEADANVDTVIAEVVEALAIEADKAHVRIVRKDDAAELAGCRVPLGVDLAQIVTNLALNALAYSPKAPNKTSDVRIVTTVGARDVTVDVEDDGPGISEERASSVFEGDTTRPGGAGVGLMHARATARAAGGELLLVDKRPGSTFRVTWPRDLPTISTRDAVLEPKASRPKLQVLAGTKVLIVEDDSDVTDLLESALTTRGAEVTIARNAAELAERIDAGHTAVLVDLSPIASDVSGALALVKKRAKDAAIVFITGSAEALPEGMEDAAWLRKPFEVGELIAVLSRPRIP